MEKYSNLNVDMTETLNHIDELWKYIEENNLQDEQSVLDFLDKLNEISIRN